MAGYDYGNARLRAMRSRLLSRPDLEAFAEIRKLDNLVTALTKTDYRRSVESAVVRARGIDQINEALRLDLIEKFARVSRFYSGREQKIVMTVLRSYDVHNLKTVLRGLSNRVSPEEIRMALIPVGELTGNVLDDLIRTSEPRIAIDLLASMRFAIARPLLKLRAEQPGASVVEMELALHGWYFQEAYQQGSDHILTSAVSLDADIINLLTALRFAQFPPERYMLGKWPGARDLRSLFIGPGHLSFDTLVRVAQQNALDDVVNALAGTIYESALRNGLAVYHQSKRLSDIEKQLKHLRLRWMMGLVIKDPLGIGIPLNYFALKTNEVENIRWIAQGINLGFDPRSIKQELEFPL